MGVARGHEELPSTANKSPRNFQQLEMVVIDREIKKDVIGPHDQGLPRKTPKRFPRV